MPTFLNLGDSRIINVNAIAYTDHIKGRLKVVFLTQQIWILSGDQAQILLTHLERRAAYHAQVLPAMWPEGVGTPIGDS
jgi:hypothetical protein